MPPFNARAARAQQMPRRPRRAFRWAGGLRARWRSTSGILQVRPLSRGAGHPPHHRRGRRRWTPRAPHAVGPTAPRPPARLPRGGGGAAAAARGPGGGQGRRMPRRRCGRIAVAPEGAARGGSATAPTDRTSLWTADMGQRLGAGGGGGAYM